MPHSLIYSAIYYKRYKTPSKIRAQTIHINTMAGKRMKEILYFIQSYISRLSFSIQSKFHKFHDMRMYLIYMMYYGIMISHQKK